MSFLSQSQYEVKQNQYNRRLLRNSVENSTKAETSSGQTISQWIATTILQINKSIIALQAFFKFCSSAGHRCHSRESSSVTERVDSILS